MAKIEKYRKGAELGENEASSFVNYAVKKKPEDKYKLKRIMMVCGYILFALIYCVIFLVLIKLPMLIALLPVLIWILTYFTWLWVNIDYEYIIVGGVFKLSEIFGMRYFRELCSVRVSEMILIAPYYGEYKIKADAVDENNRCYGLAGKDSQDVYFGIYNNNGKKCAVFFEATEKSLKVIKYYKSDVVITKTRY